MARQHSHDGYRRLGQRHQQGGGEAGLGYTGGAAGGGGGGHVVEREEARRSLLQALVNDQNDTVV